MCRTPFVGNTFIILHNSGRIKRECEKGKTLRHDTEGSWLSIATLKIGHLVGGLVAAGSNAHVLAEDLDKIAL